ncbi:hypothetical protein Ahia01_000860600 [Argonauta hians]
MEPEVKHEKEDLAGNSKVSIKDQKKVMKSTKGKHKAKPKKKEIPLKISRTKHKNQDVTPGSSEVKTQSAQTAKVTKRRHKRVKKNEQEDFSKYIYKILKVYHPSISISCNSMAIMNSFLNDLFERIASEARIAAQHIKLSTLSSNEIQIAVRLLLPGSLARFAALEGSKAVVRYITSRY